VLCAANNALYKPTSDGHAETKELWLPQHTQSMCLDEVVDLCRRCHRKAPFCFYNGNTFDSIIALAIKRLALPADEAYIIRSLAGHIVTGLATEEEVRAFREFYAGMDPSQAD
jgi:hypothetical protein